MLQHHGLVMFSVPGSIEKSHPALLKMAFHQGKKILLSRIMIQLLHVSYFSGSWPNHFRSSEEGAMSLAQRSSAAFSLEMPLGHSRSVRILYPSDSSGLSYTRFNCMSIVKTSFHAPIVSWFIKGKCDGRKIFVFPENPVTKRL